MRVVECVSTYGPLKAVKIFYIKVFPFTASWHIVQQHLVIDILKQKYKYGDGRAREKKINKKPT